jgi:hypothetical protein
MKTTYKTIVAAGALGIMTLVAPLSTFAQTNVNARANFCSQIDTRGQALVQKITDRTQKVTDKKTTRLTAIEMRRDARDATRTTNRGNRDTVHDARYDELMAKADTDAERAAVTAFETTTESTVATRRAAIDSAVSTYRDGVDALINGKWGTLDGSVATFTQSVNQALDTAKSSCASGTDSAAVRATFTASVKSAHDMLKSSRADAVIKADLDALIAARKQSVASAVTQFKSTMESAKTTLKAAFGN